jgi:GTP pyrophosphokinase
MAAVGWDQTPVAQRAVEDVASPTVGTPELVHENSLLKEAFVFARGAHHGPRRRGDTDISHPLAVAEILHEEGWPEEVLAAALLHDVIEDTATQLHEIQARFGSRTAGIVSGMTEDATIPSYAERKAEHRSRVTHSADVAAVYAADKLAKVRGPDSDQLSEAQLQHYCETHRVLAETHPEIPFLADLREELGRLRVRDELIRSTP